jgi:hypothetical protein
MASIAIKSIESFRNLFWVNPAILVHRFEVTRSGIFQSPRCFHRCPSMRSDAHRYARVAERAPKLRRLLAVITAAAIMLSVKAINLRLNLLTDWFPLAPSRRSSHTHKILIVIHLSFSNARSRGPQGPQAHKVMQEKLLHSQVVHSQVLHFQLLHYQVPHLSLHLSLNQLHPQRQLHRPRHLLHIPRRSHAWTVASIRQWRSRFSSNGTARWWNWETEGRWRSSSSLSLAIRVVWMREMWRRFWVVR